MRRVLVDAAAAYKLAGPIHGRTGLVQSSSACRLAHPYLGERKRWYLVAFAGAFILNGPGSRPTCVVFADAISAPKARDKSLVACTGSVAAKCWGTKGSKQTRVELKGFSWACAWRISDKTSFPETQQTTSRSLLEFVLETIRARESIVACAASDTQLGDECQ